MKRVENYYPTVAEIEFEVINGLDAEQNGRNIKRVMKWLQSILR